MRTIWLHVSTLLHDDIVKKYRQSSVIAFRVFTDTVDEKIMLIHVYLHTRGTTIEVK